MISSTKHTRAVRDKILRKVAIAFWGASIFLFCLLVSFIMGFDGVVIQGLDAKIGTVRLGHTFKQVIYLQNFTPVSVRIDVLPNCGCAVDTLATYTVPAWSAASIPILYNANDPKKGIKKRDVFLKYNHAGVIRNVQGSIRFTQG